MKILRTAGWNEKRCIIRENLKLYNSIVTIGIYAQRLSRDQVVAALKTCILEHPALSVVVKDADTEQPGLFQVQEVDVAKHMTIEEGQGQVSLKDMLESLHYDPVATEEDVPQWRVLVAHAGLGKTHVAFACSHALMDGMSGFAFHKTFKHALATAVEDTAELETIVRISNVKGLLPPMDSRLYVSWSYLLGPVIKEYFPKSIAALLGFKEQKPEKVWLGASKRPEREGFPHTSVHILTIPADTLQHVLAKCRTQNSRLTALLHHLFARALADSLSKRNQDYTTFVCQTSIDLRRALDSGRDQMCNYVSSVSETITPQDDLDWSAIQALTQKLGEASSKTQDQPVGLLKYLSNYREWTLKNAAQAPDASFEISNLGVYKGGEESTVEVEEMVFSQSANGTGPPLSINVASGRSSLTLSLTWWSGTLGVEEEKGFVEKVCGSVHQALQKV